MTTAAVERKAGSATYTRILGEIHDLLPDLTARATRTEELRKLPDETVSDLKTANLFSCFSPKHYGGLELDWAHIADFTMTLGTACGSSSWIVTASAAHNMLLGRFPEKAQDDVYSKGPEIIVSMALAGEGQLVRKGNNYILHGRWQFASGIDHADWVIVGVKTEEMDPSGRNRFYWILVDSHKVTIHDTWRAIGLRGTGSNDIEVTNLSIPEHHVLASDECDQALPPGAALHSSYIYRVEYFHYFRACLIGPILGVTRGALQAYVHQTRGRIGRIASERVVDQLPVQVKISESAAELRAAELLGRYLRDTLADRGRQGTLRLSAVDRVALNRDLPHMARLCNQSVDRLAGMMGASGIGESNSVHRLRGDLTAMSAHGAMQWERYLAPYGQWVFGVPSGDPVIDREPGEPGMEDFFLRGKS